MVRFFSILAALTLLGVSPSPARQTPAANPTGHLIGTITKSDPAAHDVTVKEDKTGTEYVVLLENTRTLLKVLPGAKDLKSASRITAGDLQPGDRVTVLGAKPGDASAAPNTIAARSVLLMSARDLEQAHQQEAAAWQRSTAGIVNSIDPAGQSLSISVRAPEGRKTVTVTLSPSTGFTRYSAQDPKTPAPSQLSDIQPGDQVRVLGQTSEDGATIAAQRIYSGAFRTIAGTVTAIGPDGKQVTIKDLQTKQPVEVTLSPDSVLRKLPPALAMGLARHLNPDFKAAQSNAASSDNAGNAGGAPPYGAKAGEAVGPGGQAVGPGGQAAGPGGQAAGNNPGAANRWSAGGNGGPGAHANPGGPQRGGNGDLSRLLERAPAITVSDLKTGDAVVVSGVAQGAGKSHLIASSIIAGVEPIFQSAPPQQGRSLGDWSLDMQVPAQQ